MNKTIIVLLIIVSILLTACSNPAMEEKYCIKAGVALGYDKDDITAVEKNGEPYCCVHHGFCIKKEEAKDSTWIVE